MTDSTIAAVVAAADFGTPAARKTGRDARWPYVPVVITTDGVAGRDRQSQVLGLAYATRDEAVDAAERHIAHQREQLAENLADPRYRALRRQHGLPAEL